MRRELMKRFENSHELIGYTLNVGYINATSIPVSLASRWLFEILLTLQEVLWYSVLLKFNPWA